MVDTIDHLQNIVYTYMYIYQTTLPNFACLFCQFLNRSLLHSNTGGCKLWFIDSQYTRGRCPRGMDHERFSLCLVDLFNMNLVFLNKWGLVFFGITNFQKLLHKILAFHISFDLPHQVLPDDMIVLAKPDPIDMVQAIQKAISMLPTINPQAMHLRVSQFSKVYTVSCKRC